METVREPLVVLAFSLKVISANRSFYETFQVTPIETEGRSIFEIGNHQWDIPALRKLLEEIIPKNTHFNNFEVNHDFSAIGRKRMLLNARRVYREGEGTDTILLAIEDISARREMEEALKISEARYRRLFETAQDGILILDAETGQISDVNPFLVEMLGYSHEDFLGKKLWEIGAFKDIEASKAAFSELQSKGYVRYNNLPLERKDGRSMAVEFVSNVYLANHHKVIQCNIRDITGRKKVEEALRQSEERFRFLVQQVKDYSIIYLDTEGRIVSLNEGAERIYGYREEEVIGKHFSILYPKEGIERGDPWRTLEIAVAEGQFKGEGWRVRKDGSRFWSDVVITALHDEIGALKGFSRVARDITERRNAEEAINHRLAMEELVVKISNRFINIDSEQLDNEINRALEVVKNFTDADRGYLCLRSNDGFRIAHVYESLSSGVGSRAGELLQGLSLESFPWMFNKLKRGEEICVFNITDLPPEAAVEKEYWRTHSTVQALVAIPLILEQKLLGYLALNSDQKRKRWASEDIKLLRLVGEIFANALERKKAEKKRRELELEILKRQEREFELQRAENEKWIGLGQMASGIAHDIRNPINYVSLALDHISGKEKTAKSKGTKTRKLIENAHSELMRVNDMVQGLLEYGRTQASQLEMESASQILAESIAEVLRRHPDEESRICLEEIEESFPILMQRDLLLRALVNLIENALEAGGPNVEVRTGVNYNPRKRDEIVLWVQDSGTGILEENFEKIFTPFFTTKKSGIGLGLTLVQKWVREMGGQIKVSNVPEGGARFEILFPVKGPKIESKG